jgi:DNA (cytosine-5)-methyltransferase 1
VKALGCYIFAGGFTVGVKRAGFDVVGHLEDGPFGVATSKLNHPELADKVWTDPERWPLDQMKDEGIDFVYGNPPCAPWSQAGMSPTQKRGVADNWWEHDPRVGCVYQMFDVLEKVRPKVWAWESVARAAVAGRPLIDSLAARAAALGYACSIVLLNGADAGVPQDRKRVFVVFHNVGVPWQMTPVPRKTVREALADIVATPEEVAAALAQSKGVTKTYKEMREHVAPGASLAIEFNKLHGTTYEKGHRVAGRPAFLYRRLSWDQLAFTTTGAARHFHPDEPRLLTVSEQAALCGYPAGYRWHGNASAAYEQMSKAVLPSAGEWLARNVRAGIEANQEALYLGTPQVFDFIDAAGPALTTRGTIRVAPPSPSRPKMPRVGLDAVAKRFADAIDKKILKDALAAFPPVEPARPAQESSLPVWETFSGPSALARQLIAEGHADGPILAATSQAMHFAREAGATWPTHFHSGDLARLRARMAKKAAAA